MPPFGNLAYRPVVTPYQNTEPPCSDAQKLSSHQDSKNNHTLLPPSILRTAATAYLSGYDSALLRCHDAAEAELKAQLWPLVANKMKAALGTSDEFNPDDLKNLHSRLVSDIQRKANGTGPGHLHPRKTKPLKRRAESAAGDAQLGSKKLIPRGLPPILITPILEEKTQTLPIQKRGKF